MGLPVELGLRSLADVIERIEALVRLTAAQKVEIDGLRQQAQVRLSPLILHFETIVDTMSDAVLVLATRKGQFVVISDDSIDVWKNEADFIAGLEEKALAVVKLTP
jgi:hypothetical protein